MEENHLVRKLKFTLKLMTSSGGKLIITIHISSNIAKSKDNQIMNFVQLIEHNVKMFFLKNHTQNVVEKLFPVSSIKNLN